MRQELQATIHQLPVLGPAVGCTAVCVYHRTYWVAQQWEGCVHKGWGRLATDATRVRGNGGPGQREQTNALVVIVSK